MAGIPPADTEDCFGPKGVMKGSVVRAFPFRRSNRYQFRARQRGFKHAQQFFLLTDDRFLAGRVSSRVTGQAAVRKGAAAGRLRKGVKSFVLSPIRWHWQFAAAAGCHGVENLARTESGAEAPRAAPNAEGRSRNAEWARLELREASGLRRVHRHFARATSFTSRGSNGRRSRFFPASPRTLFRRARP